MSWLGALYCAPLTVKMAYLLTRAGGSSYSAVRRVGSWVFRKSVTDGFGNVTGHFGDVTDGSPSVF